MRGSDLFGLTGSLIRCCTAVRGRNGCRGEWDVHRIYLTNLVIRLDDSNFLFLFKLPWETGHLDF